MALKLKKKFDTFLNHTLDDVAVNEFGFMKTGSGNSVHDFIAQQNDKYDVEGALAIKARQGDTFSPTKVTKDGVIVYDVAGGPQVVNPDLGVPVAHAGRAMWSFDYSLSSNINGQAESPNLEELIEHDNFKFKLGIDLDPSKKTKMLWLTADYDETAHPGGSHIVWRNKQGDIVIGDDGGDGSNTANSQNVAFYAAAIDSNPNEPGIQPYDFGPGKFDFRLFGKTDTGKVFMDVHTQVRVHGPDYFDLA